MGTINNNDLQFWIEIETEQGVQIYIVKSKFINFLENRGYRKLIQNKDFQLIKIIDTSIVIPTKEHIIREEVKKHLLNINKVDVWETFLGQDYLSKKFIEGIDSISIDFNYGSENTAVFFYQNGVLNVTSNSFNLIPYKNYDGYVWEDQILKRDFKSQKIKNTEFKQFCWNISGQKENRLIPLETLIGYLLHTYKDPSLTKAIVLIDENIDFENNKSEGGTGKSLIAESIKKIVPTLRKNGKLLKTNDKFFFADVEPYHKVIVFDDVKQDFSFESLYSMITGDMPIEKKYKNPTVMDFKDVPKVIITSNYIVMGTGGNSEKRRKIVFEINSHYRENSSIIEEFGHRFFDDWTDEEWLRFDNYMMFCIQQYLNNGLIEAESINEEKNRLIQETNLDFVDFMDSIIENPIANDGETKDTRARFDKAIIYKKFTQENPELAKDLTPNSFKKWIDTYAENKKIKILHQKSNGLAYVIFHDIIPIVESEKLPENED
ncbi:hypothetical protein A0O34_05250 [Chryseobacterium glaciei]|uniref:NrS-1 polymerase-like helicase domain-containing protein n=1 Tax=Chryseobacterium glaciei TaxID=1685010 RepID=A0A172XSH8_9FLAO|nr:primase-helicase family protein [Chryseobacterium glaciei]ANF49969.1 hypothetical protein A0O34_05250 [Chryseobacterium glaciei]